MPLQRQGQPCHPDTRKAKGLDPSALAAAVKRADAAPTFAGAWRSLRTAARCTSESAVDQVTDDLRAKLRDHAVPRQQRRRLVAQEGRARVLSRLPALPLRALEW